MPAATMGFDPLWGGLPGFVRNYALASQPALQSHGGAEISRVVIARFVGPKGPGKLRMTISMISVIPRVGAAWRRGGAQGDSRPPISLGGVVGWTKTSVRSVIGVEPELVEPPVMNR